MAIEASDGSSRRTGRRLWNVAGAPRIVIPFVLFLLLAASTPARATEEFAKATGKQCAYCHLDPGGGGELTAAGTGYAASLQLTPKHPRSGLPARIFRVAVGYLHILTAIFWFGTILYVHLILKPAYASQGLPRGEVRVGLGSMAVMGVTGAILTCYRVTSLDMFLHTRFGILLLIKIGLYLVMVVSALLAVLVIGPRLRSKKGASPIPATGNLSPAELALCDGAEGRPAYFAWNNRIFDATASRLWKHGVHMGRHSAGTDLTEALHQAPHGEDKILALTQVGELVGGGMQKPAPPVRMFYVMAYLNLSIVFAIVLILALWRWG